MKKIHEERLLKLVAHLESGKLGHEVFYFGHYNTEADMTAPVADISDYEPVGAPRCGTAGCAIGECPILFPRSWKFNSYGWPTLRAGSHSDPMDAAREFFGLSYGDAASLFLPGPADGRCDGVVGPRLGRDASKQEVAQHIRRFIFRARMRRGTTLEDY
jgi:hypothetical protein